MKKKFISLLTCMLFCTGFALFCQTESSTFENDSSYFNTEAVVEGAAQTAKTPGTLGLFVRMIIVLVIVIALIYGVLWFIKRKTNIVKNDDDFLRRAAYINIAPGKTVEVITLIDKAYLIGVTEDNITLLGEIQDKELINAMNLASDKKQNTSKPVNFNDVLNMFTGKTSKSKNIFTESEKKVESLFNKNGESGTDNE